MVESKSFKEPFLFRYQEVLRRATNRKKVSGQNWFGCDLMLDFESVDALQHFRQCFVLLPLFFPHRQLKGFSPHVGFVGTPSDKGVSVPRLVLAQTTVLSRLNEGVDNCLQYKFVH